MQLHDAVLKDDNDFVSLDCDEATEIGAKLPPSSPSGLSLQGSGN